MTGAARLAHLALVLTLASALSFILLALLPGDAAVAILGEQATAEELNALRQELALDRPMHERYGSWLTGAVRGDLGTSLRSGVPVSTLIGERLPATLQLMLLAQCLALLLAVPAALLAAANGGRRADRWLTAGALAGLSTPTYVYALALITLFAVHLNWLPATGYVPFTDAPLANLRSLLLPALTVALAEAPIYFRVLRHALADALKADHTRTLRANGIGQARLLFKYALRPSSLTLITLVSLSIGNLMAGAVIVESVFALPGMGRLLVEAVYARDVMVIQGAVLVGALAFVGINLAADVLSETIDPRRATA